MRPDLVYGARDLPPPPPDRPGHRGGLTWLAALASRCSRSSPVGLAVAAALVILVAPRQLQPRRAREGRRRHGHRRRRPGATRRTPARSPTTAPTASSHAALGTAVAGLVGIAVTFAVCAGLVLVVRRRRNPRRRRRRHSRPRTADVGGAHRHLLVHHEGPLHRVAPQASSSRTVLFVVAVVATPKEGSSGRSACSPGWWCSPALIGRAVALGVARRLVIEVPFLLFAVLLPFLGAIPRSRCSGSQLSEPGLWAAWNIVAKGTIGVAASIVLASTTSVPHVLLGLERLRVPRQLVAITASHGALRRRSSATSCGGCASPRVAAAGPGRIGARPRRGHLGRGPVRAVLRGGERVYLAMASRGYQVDATCAARRPRGGRGSCALMWPAMAAAVAAAAWSVNG